MNNAVANPFGSKTSAIVETAGARQSQSRELAEMQTKYLMAQRFPRDVVSAMDRILNAFTRPTLAEKADAARQEIHPAAIRDQPAGDEAHGEMRALRRHHQVAAQRHVAAEPGRRAVHRGDRRER